MPDSGRKILIITYYWPPSGGPGALRMVKWVKYLVRSGWQPVVLTVSNGEFPFTDPDLASECPESVPVYRIRAPNVFGLYKRLAGRKSDEPLPVGLLTYSKKSLIEKMSAWIRANLFIPDARKGWVEPAARKALKLIRQENIRHVLISSPPHSSQLIGLQLKRRTDVQWIADLRDPWTRIRYYESVHRNWFSRKLDSVWERRVLQSADRVTTVSQALADAFGSIRQDADAVHVLMNGWDSDDFPEIREPDSHKFRIVHTGNLLENQNPAVLWRTLGQWVKENPDLRTDLEIRLTGRVHPAVMDSLDLAGLSGMLVQQGFLPHDKVLPEIRQATLLFVSIPDMPGNRGVVTGKLLEYTGSGKPILVIGPQDGDAARIVRSLSNGKCIDYEDIRACGQFVRTLYGLWKQSLLPVSAKTERSPYSRETVTGQLIRLMQSEEA